MATDQFGELRAQVSRLDDAVGYIEDQLTAVLHAGEDKTSPAVAMDSPFEVTLEELRQAITRLQHIGDRVVL